MDSIQFSGDNIDAVGAFLHAKVHPPVVTGPSEADPALRIAGRRYFMWDIPGWGLPAHFAHIVEGDWLVRVSPTQVTRYYPDQYATDIAPLLTS